MSDSPKYTDEELDNVANLLNESITTLPVDGIFKVRISNPMGQEERQTIQVMIKQLAENLGRPDVTVIVEGIGDLN